MKLTPTKPFLRDLKKLAKTDAKAVSEAMGLFMKNPQAKILNFEKVTSRTGYFTIRGTYSIRVLMQHNGKEAYDAVAVGNHDYIYVSYFKR
jgi:mRNA-degrading endonuclease RelE of RelBE toxin-antitoxin system